MDKIQKKNFALYIYYYKRNGNHVSQRPFSPDLSILKVSLFAEMLLENQMQS
jgi:hypothetical protein